VCADPPADGQAVAVLWPDTDGSLRWHRTENIKKHSKRWRAVWDGWQPIQLSAGTRLRADRALDKRQWCLIKMVLP
jgi:hypothetical protein